MSIAAASVGAVQAPAYEELIARGQALVPEFAERAAKQGVPLVAVGSHAGSSFDIVRPQNEEPAIAQAVDHLVELGHRRVGFIGHVRKQVPPEPRLAALRQRLREHGLDHDDHLVRYGARDRMDAYEAATSLLNLAHPPTAIISGSDIGGIATIWAAHRLGLQVPEDLAVIGCGNIDECLISIPTLSSTTSPTPPSTAKTRS